VNPRIIEAMTDGIHIRDVAADRYAAAFLYALNNPLLIWDIAFRTHIAPMCQHLLFSLFFCSEYGVEIDELRGAFNPLHSYLCNKFAIPHAAKDFEEALKILEGGFIEIRDRQVSFVNPSLRDYLIAYLDDANMLRDFALTAQKAIWAREVWTHVRVVRPVSPDQQEEIATAFLKVSESFTRLPNVEEG
jgi:hypothetical protein